MGHLARAAALARQRVGPATILHSAPRPVRAPGCRLVAPPPGAGRPWLRAFLERALEAPRRLLVDTFPGGLFGEITDAALARARERILVQRYVRPGARPGYEALAARYDARWLPYPADRCEWEGEIGGEHVGPLARPIPLAGPRAPLVVIGDPARLPPGWRRLLPPGCVTVNGPFDALPPAGGYVCVGAGYGLTWELVGAGLRALHLPLPRRYDDQHRRALMLGRAALTRADLAAFIQEVTR